MARNCLPQLQGLAKGPAKKLIRLSGKMGCRFTRAEKILCDENDCIIRTNNIILQTMTPMGMEPGLPAS